jgi:hypothetical protein
MFHLKAPVGLQIGRHYPEKKITVSRHDLALDYLRHFPDFLDKLIWSYDPTQYGLASSYPELLTALNPEDGAAFILNLRL